MFVASWLFAILMLICTIRPYNLAVHLLWVLIYSLSDVFWSCYFILFFIR